MAATPFIMNHAPAITNFILQTPLPKSVRARRNKIVGKTIYESGIRSNYNLTVLAIKRGEKYITDVLPDEVIGTDDILYILGGLMKKCG